MIEGCDTLLMVGSSFPYAEWLPEPGQARGVQIDIDARMIGIRYPMELNLVGDSAETLRALIPLLQRKEDRGWRETSRATSTRWWEILDAQAHEPANPLNPQLLFHELKAPARPGHPHQRLGLGHRLVGASPADARRHEGGAVGDAGQHVPRRALRAGGEVRLPRPARDRHDRRRRHADAGQPRAHRPRAATSDRWPNRQLVVLVLHNNDLNQVTWEQRVMSGDPKLEVSQTLPDFPYARYAEMIGLKGIRVDSPDAVGAAWDEALAAGGPAVIEAITDPEVPPLPPHIRFEQAQELAHALPGDPARGQIIRNALKGKIDELVNR